jgi:hypothetical protein
LFRLRAELNRSYEQLKQYQELIDLINKKSFPITNLDDFDYSDCIDDDSKPIEKNFYLNDNNEKKFLCLYSKTPLPSEDDDLSKSLHVENEIQ